MSTEIERRFLLSSEIWKKLPSEQIHINQGYILTQAKAPSFNLSNMEIFIGNGQSIPLRKRDAEVFENISLPNTPILNLSKCTVRVRTENRQVMLAVKVHINALLCTEIQYKLPWKAGIQKLKECDVHIQKTRHRTPYLSNIVEIDVFHGFNAGLTLAEVEFKTEKEAQAFTPEHVPFLGQELTGIKRYSSKQLAITPYHLWTRQMQIKP